MFDVFRTPVKIWQFIEAVKFRHLSESDIYVQYVNSKRHFTSVGFQLQKVKKEESKINLVFYNEFVIKKSKRQIHDIMLAIDRMSVNNKWLYSWGSALILYTASAASEEAFIERGSRSHYLNAPSLTSANVSPHFLLARITGSTFESFFLCSQYMHDSWKFNCVTDHLRKCGKLNKTKGD